MLKTIQDFAALLLFACALELYGGVWCFELFGIQPRCCPGCCSGSMGVSASESRPMSVHVPSQGTALIDSRGIPNPEPIP